MASPCNNSPDEVVEKIVLAKANADKFDKFVNGTDTQNVQLGSGFPTPTIRNAVRQIKADGEWIKQFIADAPEGDVSLNNVTALGSVASRTLTERFSDIVNIRDFGAKGDGVTDDTASVQAALDYAVNQDGPLVFFPAGTYLLSKSSNSELYPDGDEPCVFIYGATNLTLFGEGACLKVAAHGQTAIEIRDSSNVTVEGLEIEGYGTFPQLDSNSGMAEKGNVSGGYFDGTHYFPWFKNNSIDTSNYKGFAGDSNYTWGSFGNGFIGSMGAGILVYDGCQNITINRCNIHSFNYSAINVGTGEYTGNINSLNVKITNCALHDCYDRGITLSQVDVVFITNNNIYNIGHPDLLDDIDFGWNHSFEPNPGYGVCCQKSLFRPTNVSIQDNNIVKCARIGIDSHCSNGISVIGNYIEKCAHFSINLSDGGVAIADYLTDHIICSNNRIRYSGALRVSSSVGTNYNPNIKRNSPVISGNSIYMGGRTSFGVIFVQNMSGAVISNNVIRDIWSTLGTQEPSAIYIGSGNELNSSTPKMENVTVTGNSISIQNIEFQCRPMIYGAAIKNATISGNVAEEAIPIRGIEISFSENVVICNNILKCSNTEGASSAVKAYNSSKISVFNNFSLSGDGVDTDSTELCVFKNNILSSLDGTVCGLRFNNYSICPRKNDDTASTAVRLGDMDNPFASIWGGGLALYQSRVGNPSLFCLEFRHLNDKDKIVTTGIYGATIDGDVDLGGPSNRWDNVWASNGTIATSDQRLKDNILDISEPVLEAWGKVRFKVFQFKDALEEKGESARIHIGVIAQDIKEAFESCGLDVSRYGLFCHDKWEDQYEEVPIVDAEAVYDENGEIVTPEQTHMEKRLTMPAGDRYSVRYEELLALECAYQRWRLEQIEARLNEISGNRPAPSGASPDNP